MAITAVGVQVPLRVLKITIKEQKQKIVTESSFFIIIWFSKLRIGLFRERLPLGSLFLFDTRGSYTGFLYLFALNFKN
jgi:hypothetical protein